MTKVATIGDKRVRYATKVWNNSLSNATTYGEELTINITFFCGGLDEDHLTKHGSHEGEERGSHLSSW